VRNFSGRENMRRNLFALAVATVTTLTSVTLMADEAEDKAIAQQIAATLRDSGKMQGYSVGVKFKNGTAWLSGRVTSKEQAAAALLIASNVEGVEQIVNNLTIGPTSSEAGQSSRASTSKGKSKPKASRETALASAQTPLGQPIGSGTPAGYQQLPPACLANNGGMRPMPMQGPGQMQMPGQGQPIPAYAPGAGGQAGRATYDQAHMPNYAWPSYAAYPNYAAVTYPKQYSASAWPFIGPFYPYPQVPLGWRRVSLEWDDGWWFLDFDDRGCQ
jgi:hypothetical protein